MCAFASAAQYLLSADGAPAGSGAAGIQRGAGERKGKIIDGNRICHELGFEYQYPDPLVMPME